MENTPQKNHWEKLEMYQIRKCEFHVINPKILKNHTTNRGLRV